MNFPLCSNERVREAIDRLIPSHRLPHAVIIEGVSGTGKRTLGDYLAKATLCEGENPPCDGCRTCQLAKAGTHPDIKWLAPEKGKKNIAVGQVDYIRELAYLTPHTAFGKVFIIEQAETMNSAAQNKLLKLLEEPPANVFFILLCESASDLLDTVLSRCTVFSLTEPDFDSAIKVLEARGYSRSDIVEPLTLNKNNIGNTLKALGSAKTSLGIEVASEFFKYIEANDKINALKCTVRLEKNRQQADTFIKELKLILIERIKASARLPATRLEYTKMYDAVTDMEDALLLNVNLTLFFTALVSRLTGLKLL